MAQFYPLQKEGGIKKTKSRQQKKTGLNHLPPPCTGIPPMAAESYTDQFFNSRPLHLPPSPHATGLETPGEASAPVPRSPIRITRLRLSLSRTGPAPTPSDGDMAPTISDVCSDGRPFCDRPLQRQAHHATTTLGASNQNSTSRSALFDTPRSVTPFPWTRKKKTLTHRGSAISR